MRRTIAVVGVIGAIAVGGGVFVVAGAGGSAPAATPASVATTTTKVTRRDLVETDTESGVLTFDDERPVVNRLPGTVTWVPDEGARIEPSHALFDVNGQAVYLLDGTVTPWRDLKDGESGDDVLALERNLRALHKDPGHDMSIDGDWDAGTTNAVKRWQEGKGLEQTGVIELGRVVFAPGTRRVSSTTATTTPTGTQVLTTTSTRKVVTVALKTADAQIAREGEDVTVTLPSGKDVGGRITTVGKVATVPASATASSGDTDVTEATIDVDIRLSGDGDGSALDHAPVQVSFERSRRENVLAIPVTALLATAGSGFAVEAREGTNRRPVPVVPGLFASGYVEISGDGIDEGMTVTNSGL